jgi:hypothetical protein
MLSSACGYIYCENEDSSYATRKCEGRAMRGRRAQDPTELMIELPTRLGISVRKKAFGKKGGGGVGGEGLLQELHFL